MFHTSQSNSSRHQSIHIGTWFFKACAFESRTGFKTTKLGGVQAGTGIAFCPIQIHSKKEDQPKKTKKERS